MSSSFHSSRTPHPRISIIVVNYNGGDKLTECLSALLDDRLSPPFEILLVDNASQDDSDHLGLFLASRHENFHYLKSDTNLGYAGGINFGLPHAKAEYIAALNMDIRISPGWLISLVDFLDNDPKTGAVNPLILLENDPSRVNAAGQSVHVTALGFNRGFGKPRSKIGSAPIEISGVQGGAFLVRKSLLLEMGGLDETGFLYHEDVDLSWLLLIKGYSLFCIPDSIVYHDYRLSMYPMKLYLLERNRIVMLLCYLRLSTILFLTPWLIFTELLLWLYCLLRGVEFLRAKASSYRWVYSRRKLLTQRKRTVETQRVRRDLQILRKLSWGYAWDQFLILGTEQSISVRQPKGGIPINIG